MASFEMTTEVHVDSNHFYSELAVHLLSDETSGTTYIADSGRCRSAFRSDGDRDSEVMPITIPG
jgi:hypothetical protein